MIYMKDKADKVNRDNKASNKWHKLFQLGAEGFEHIDGSLMDHLNGTRTLLREWSASPSLQDAGLYHAAYGTAGFDECLVSVQQRDEIANIIGKAAEELVYQYCACDRDDFLPKIGLERHPEFLNRFTGQRYYLKEDLLKQFCELTAANETQIAMGCVDFMQQYGEELRGLFHNMKPYLSGSSWAKVVDVFNCIEAEIKSP